MHLDNIYWSLTEGNLVGYIENNFSFFLSFVCVCVFGVGGGVLK
jgi:hypothetical protein